MVTNYRSKLGNISCIIYLCWTPWLRFCTAYCFFLMKMHDLNISFNCTWLLFFLKMFPISIHLDRRVNALFITSSVGKNMRTTTHNGFFPKWNRNSVNSGNLRNHWSMGLFKILSHPCLAVAVVASWSPTGEAASSNPFNNKYVWLDELSEST